MGGGTGGIRGVSGRSGSRGPAASTSAAFLEQPEAWTEWWAHNRDVFLWDVLASDAPRGPITAAGQHRTDRPAERSALPHAPSRAQIYTRLVPVLLERIETEDDAGALAEAVLAVGRMARAPFDEPVADALLPLLAHDDARVAQSAAVAFGLLGGEDGRDALHELSTCSHAGHELAGRSRVPDGLRIMATLSLGLLGDESSSPRLRDLAEGGLDAGDELRASAILALGIMGEDADGGTAPWLDEWSQDRRLPLNLQVSLATSLGRVDDDRSASALVAILEDRDSDAPTHQAAVAALGRAASLDDAAAVSALVDAVEEGRDAGTRQLALLSLARLATSEASTPETLDARKSIDRLVRRELRKPSHSVDRPFTALAAGLLMRGRPELRRDLGVFLIEAYDDASDPSQRGAFALGLGLGRVDDGAPSLRDDLADTRDTALQGHLAVALGLLGDEEAAPLLRERLLADGQTQDLREDVATGLRLLDDGYAVRVLADAYVQASNAANRDGLAAALGELRHAHGVDALLSACRDDRLDAGSRASAYAALGRLAESTAEPFTVRLTRDDAPAHAPGAVQALSAR
jgi:hypothetical protein